MKSKHLKANIEPLKSLLVSQTNVNLKLLTCWERWKMNLKTLHTNIKIPFVLPLFSLKVQNFTS